MYIKNGFHPYFHTQIHSYLEHSTFLPHILYTHLQSKCSLHIKNKYIYTEKKKKPNMNK